MSTETLQTLAATLEQLATKTDLVAHVADDALRVRLLSATRAVASRLEIPFDSFFRLIFTDMTLGLAQTGTDLGIWSLIAKRDPESVTAADLAKELNILEPTVERVMRYAVGENMVDETGENTYRANNLTRYFAGPRGDSVIYLANSAACRVGSAMPEFFSNNKQIAMQQARPRAWNLAVGTDKEVWEWLAEEQNKRVRDSFNDFMWAQAHNLASFADAFPLNKYVQLEGADPERKQFVDVGGGTGHISRAVLARFPALHGRMAVEDRGDLDTVSGRSDFEASGIQNIQHNFFESQPVRGAKAYYMRNILHDWNDERSGVILSHLRDAMADDTVILVDDVVIPATGANWYSGASDMMMLTNLGAIERTQKQFDELFAANGLKRAELMRYNSYGPAIQVVVKA